MQSPGQSYDYPNLKESSEFLASLRAQSVNYLPAVRETQVRFLSQEYPWRTKWQPAPVFLPVESQGQRSLEGYTVHGDAESQTRLGD